MSNDFFNGCAGDSLFSAVSFIDRLPHTKVYVIRVCSNHGVGKTVFIWVSFGQPCPAEWAESFF